jgi:virulence-associated protein VapD
MFAVAFDFEVSKLKEFYGDPYNKAYYEVKNILSKYGFTWIQGSTYVTDNEDLANLTFLMSEFSEIEWLARSVKDIRAFEIKNWSNYTDFVKRKFV